MTEQEKDAMLGRAFTFVTTEPSVQWRNLDAVGLAALVLKYAIAMWEATTVYPTKENVA